MERAGMRVRWQVEIDPYCQRVLAKHWPHVQRYGDIQSVDWGTVEPVDVLCGGFPCQDISLAGTGAGLAGERSGLWFEYAKAIDALTPRYVIIENVAALRSRGLDQVLGSLAALGYDAEWHVLSACQFGAPHTRERLFVVAYPQGSGLEGYRTLALRTWEAFSPVCNSAAGRPWSTESRPVGVAHGISHRVDRLRGLGNAVVPQIAEMIGAWILLREEVSV
jgi:DNA (cytosine-5)-methyltransferase 1